jgi:quinoprotein glucose dehydrogenase
MRANGRISGWSTVTALSAAATALALAACGPDDQGGLAVGDWPLYRGGLAGTGHSALREITTQNVASLARAWRYDLSATEPADGSRPRAPNSQATPIVVAGVMYLPAADRVVALDPATGAEIWRHVVQDGALTRRGVAHWAGEGATAPRIIFVAGSRLIALDAATGEPAAGFGAGGEVDIGVPYNSVPLVYDHIVVVGANTPPGQPGGIGNARAFDARDGSPIWEFSSVPQPGEVGHDTWGGESWQGRLGVNAWPFYFTLDAERELLYLPLAAPLPWWYGGDRPGANLFGNAVVAVDVRTGAYVWHFQTIHHDLWDHDPPAAPVLFDAELPGGTVPALGATTKSGYLYILNRETGEPIFGVEERPVPASDVPGEAASPTQPIPTRPVGTSRTSYDPSDLVTADDTSPEHAAACTDLVASVGEIYNAGPFTPWAYRGPGVPERTTLLFPGLVGGHNWGGAAFDPGSGLVFVFSQDVGTFGWIEDDPTPGALVPYRRSGPRPAGFDVDMGGTRWPCQRPPWGRLTAVDAATGDIAWQVPLGVTEGLPPGRMNTGRPGRAAAIVTAGGVVFVASTDDARFRALEATTGRELWVDVLERQGNANPMTYQGSDERQYVAVAAIDALLAYRLP